MLYWSNLVFLSKVTSALFISNHKVMSPCPCSCVNVRRLQVSPPSFFSSIMCCSWPCCHASASGNCGETLPVGGVACVLLRTVLIAGKQGQETRLRGLLDPQATKTRNLIRNLTRNLQLSFELLETGMHYATTAASDLLQTSGTSCWPCWVPVQLIASINVRKHNCARISRSRA